MIVNNRRIAERRKKYATMSGQKLRHFPFADGLDISCDTGISHQVLKDRVQIRIPDQVAGCTQL